MIPGSSNPLLAFKSAAAGGSYQISRSLRFNSADSAYLSRTPASAGNRKTWTWSGWVKRSALSIDQTLLYCQIDASNYTWLYFKANDTLDLFNTVAGAVSGRKTTSAVYRDTSAWLHVVAVWDSANGTSANRMRLYVNGEEVTAFSTYSAPSSSDSAINSTSTHQIGIYPGNFYALSGYLADIHFIDGQALTPASFGQTDATTGEWVPIAYTGTYGTNGFKLNFSNNSAATATTLGADSSGNGNNWTPTNLSVTAGSGNDSLVDTPTSYGTDTGVGGEVRGNYCTLNPLAIGANSSQITYANGNLEATWATTGTYATTLGTVGVSSGKWYWETTVTATSNQFGIATASSSLANYVGSEATSYGYYSANGQKWNNGAGSAYGSTFTTNDVIGIALDLDNGRLFFSINGVWQNSGSPTGGTGAAFTGLSGTFFPAYSEGAASSAASYACNFGQRPFAYTAPSGFKALCDTNLPAPTIVKPSTVMDVKLYTGNGGTQTISGLGFSPDLVWIKDRAQANDHQWYDSVRGTGLRLNSNLTNAEADSTPYGVTTFGASSFTVADLANGGYKVNGSSAGNTYAAWCWDAGSSTVTNTAGTISSQVRANASAGFSIVTYTGTGNSGTVGHGLGVAPEFFIFKQRNNGTQPWVVVHKSIPSWLNNYYLELNTTSSYNGSFYTFGNVAPTSSVFRVYTDTDASLARTGFNYVAYCFAPVAGYSAFGSYTGNGSANGPFVYTGFRPRWVMIKRSDVSDAWHIHDAARNPSNGLDKWLEANAASAEGNGADPNLYLDFVANGFKIRYNTARWNASAGTYVYAAFAEAPFQYARAR